MDEPIEPIYWTGDTYDVSETMKRYMYSGDTLRKSFPRKVFACYYSYSDGGMYMSSDSNLIGVRTTKMSSSSIYILFEHINELKPTRMILNERRKYG